MYNELHEAWKREQKSTKLEKLPSDFYSKAAIYLVKLERESRMLDKRTLKAQLLRDEMKHVRQMIQELVQTRHTKLFEKVAGNERISLNVLTSEEKKVYTGVLPFAEAYQSFAENILRGSAPEVHVETQRKTAVVRFLKKVPAFVGVDMETYGPFKVEDVASLPLANCKILVEKGLTEKIEI